jgi:hypothetical protein
MEGRRKARTAGQPSYIRGSGTSQATAVVSGAAALILQKNPTWTNNQVKALLATTAKPLTAGTLSPAAQGKGRLELAKAFGVTSVAAAYSYTSSSGAGSLEGARGTAHLVDNGVVLNGEKDIFGDAVSTATLASKRTAGTAWTGGTWNGRMWSGQQLHRQQLDRHHLERPDVVGAHVVQRGLVGPDVVRADVVGRDLDRAHVVWRRLVRQHLVKRRLELTHHAPGVGFVRASAQGAGDGVRRCA